MDFWSRLIAGTSLSPSSSSKAIAQNPEKRLARFRREYNSLLQIWRGTLNVARDHDAADRIRDTLQELTTILTDEARRPSPHTCLAFAANKQIYVSIGKIAATSYNEPIIREAVSVFSTLIESEEEDFLESDAFSQSLMGLLIRITGANSIRLSADTEVEVVELAFSIAAKIRLQPEFLPAWFTTDTERSPAAVDEHEKFTGRTHKEDFPLFYLLIDYIHHEGRIGDFARTGLLYIIESASNSIALEQWIVESDLATLMATGLGALYSQLSRKLVVDYAPEDLPPALVFSDYRHPIATGEIESSASSDFTGHMETFLSHLVFWQDVLEHCKSTEVKSTLLEHLQVIFLQQLLYPSLLESSDIDGGSSVAVLTYLRRILEAIDHPDMIHLILHYLLALPEATLHTPDTAPISAARKRKSMDLMTMMATRVDTSSGPELFNLVDLIRGSLQSRNQQTVSATLQLLSVILRKHHRYAVVTLLRTNQVALDLPRRTIGMHNIELDLFITLAARIGGAANFDMIYEDHLKDCLVTLESHSCSMALIAPKGASGAFKLPVPHASIPGAPPDVCPHSLRTDDPVLENLTQILETFFVNPVEMNLALTGTLVDLAVCGFMKIEGWLLPDSSVYMFDEDEDDTEYNLDNDNDPLESQEVQQLRAIRRARRVPTLPESALPDALKVLKLLTEQVEAYRAEIPRFDELLEKRRQDFQVASAAMEQITPSSKQQVIESPAPRTPSPSPATGIEGFAQRILGDIFPELADSRSSSPRGRRNQDGKSSQGTSPPSRKTNAAPPQFPMGAYGPTSGQSSRTYSPSPLRKPSTVQSVPAGQAAAFAVIEQSILNRRVGVPIRNRDLGAVPFPNLKASSHSETETTAASETEGSTRASSVTGDTDITAPSVAEEPKVSVSHVLTNALVLQEFLLELAALVQVRSGLFAEVSFS